MLRLSLSSFCSTIFAISQMSTLEADASVDRWTSDARNAEGSAESPAA
jgi:hypothetical protein